MLATLLADVAFNSLSSSYSSIYGILFDIGLTLFIISYELIYTKYCRHSLCCRLNGGACYSFF